MDDDATVPAVPPNETPTPPSFQKFADATRKLAASRARVARLEKAQKYLTKLSEALGKWHAEKMSNQSQTTED
jgi:hypothetical protein